MATVGVDSSSLRPGGLTAQVGWLGLKVGGRLALSLHSSNEPSELLHWPCRGDSNRPINDVDTVSSSVVCIQFISSLLVTFAKLVWICIRRQFSLFVSVSDYSRQKAVYEFNIHETSGNQSIKRNLLDYEGVTPVVFVNMKYDYEKSTLRNCMNSLQLILLTLWALEDSAMHC